MHAAIGRTLHLKRVFAYAHVYVQHVSIFEAAPGVKLLASPAGLIVLVGRSGGGGRKRVREREIERRSLRHSLRAPPDRRSPFSPRALSSPRHELVGGRKRAGKRTDCIPPTDNFFLPLMAGHKTE